MTVVRRQGLPHPDLSKTSERVKPIAPLPRRGRGACPERSRRDGGEGEPRHPDRPAILSDILSRLDRAYDYSSWHWQPETLPDYVCISTILVQHTNWANVEQAIERMRAAGALSLDAVLRLSDGELAELVRPAGTPGVKATRLHALAQLAAQHGGLEGLLALPATELRPLLLATHGIGPETADAILLYAAARPVFEIDAYTVRIFRRLGLGPEPRPEPSRRGNAYDAWQRWFEAALPPDTETYRRYHGLIVLHGKQTCRPKPRCAECCLLEVCETGQELR